MTETIKDQIMTIVESGLTNMLDIRTVQNIADYNGFFELSAYIDKNRYEYYEFIMTGKAPMEAN